ncbi:type VI secretion system baseplate subunit TssG [Roseomonas sp. OT10]|uniref:type VI secretion system baseplate subunit TssG n=1 Tax=Roseomonas cutis TaxID=2897332 RepID=UPI001E55C542|nr:type VI secretion system baseplate subunit TssG [Roseomonas sp. OT10]UFN47568.1 type VI secretion system baseplate subunit TssG [Roseomonas sp. OT10]
MSGSGEEDEEGTILLDAVLARSLAAAPAPEAAHGPPPEAPAAPVAAAQPPRQPAAPVAPPSIAQALRAGDPALSRDRGNLAPRERLARQPERFDLDQGIAVAAHGADARDLRYRSTARLSHAQGAIVQAEPGTRSLTLGAFGLIGPGGVLPRHQTATVAAELRKRSAALHAFLDMLGGRFAGLLAKAGAKYRPTSDPAAADRALAAAVGVGTGHLAPRAGAPLEALLYHAGHLAARTRSAERLRAMLEEEAGGRVELVEFTGGWLRLPETERTRLGIPASGALGLARAKPGAGQHSALGQGATLGAQVWDAPSRFLIRIGPLPRETFEALLPGTPGHARLVALTRMAVGLDTGFALNPILAAGEVPALALGSPRPGGPGTLGGGRLGWSSWLTPARPRRRDGDEPVFDAR